MNIETKKLYLQAEISLAHISRKHMPFLWLINP